MSDTKLTEDDDLVIVEVDKLPEQGAEPKPKVEDDEGEDKRLSEDLEDHDEEDDDLPITGVDDDTASRNRKKRKKRREAQKAAQARSDRELTFLRERNEEMARRLAAVEGRALTSDEATIEQQLADARRDVANAELIHARAIEVANGEDAVTALKLRDQARDRIANLEGSQRQVQEAKKVSPQIDPRVKSYATEWIAANPWYKADGSNDASAIANAIDKSLVAEGYIPASVDYWSELTRRVSARFDAGDKSGKKSAGEGDAPRRKAPPMGDTREHAPTSTRKEVYVTPERKQAMIEAGIWDDPVKRTKMLKTYQAYDRNSAR